jgi:hypothetical protein
MRLYFSTGKKRLAFDTERKTWNDNYFYLGGYREYIKVNNADYIKIQEEIDFNMWDYDDEF